jgi:hypothetical protein
MAAANLNPKHVLDSLALEIESLARDIRAGVLALNFGHRLALLSAISLLIAGFLPWLNVADLPTQIGLSAGGAFHLHLAALVFYLEHKAARFQNRADFSKQSTLAQEQTQKRHALWLMIIGALSTLGAIAVLFYDASINASTDQLVDIRYGFYLCLLSGIGVFAGGGLCFLGLAQSW